MSSIFKRPGSDNWWFKQRVEKDIRWKAQGQIFDISFPAHNSLKELSVQPKFGEFVTFTLGTNDKKIALVRKAMADIEYFNCRDRLRNDTQSQVDPKVAMLAKRLFDYFDVEHAEAEPALKYDWLSIEGFRQATEELTLPAMFELYENKFNDDMLSYNLTQAHYEKFENSDRSLNAMESRYGVICNWALLKNEIRAAKEGRYQLLCDFESCLNRARIERSRRIASIKIDSAVSNAPTGPVLFGDIFSEWVRLEKPKFNSQKSWKTALKNFVNFLGHDDAAKVSSFDIERWRDTFTAESKPSIITAQTSLFPCVRRMYTFGIKVKKLTYDPTRGITISLKDVEKEDVAPYTTPDMEKILKAAYLQDKVFMKWIPILMAVTGARPGEIAQLGFDQVKLDVNTDIWFIDIRPSEDGGYVKTKSSRRPVPIHRGILKDFLAFCETRKDMPLFYKSRHTKKDSVHPAQSLVGRMGPFYRSLDIDMKNKSPNHSIRHWWKSEAFRAGVDSELADKMQGHARKGVAPRYRHFDLEQMLRAIESMRIPTLDIPIDLVISSSQRQ